jgi:hypothetical protein
MLTIFDSTIVHQSFASRSCYLDSDGPITFEFLVTIVCYLYMVSPFRG